MYKIIEIKRFKDASVRRNDAGDFGEDHEALATEVINLNNIYMEALSESVH